MWFVALTIVLGWNEFWSVVTNPVYFIAVGVIIIGNFRFRNLSLGGYAMWYTGTIGPTMTVVKVAAGEVGRQISNQLKDRGVNVDRVIDGSIFAGNSPSPVKRRKSVSDGSSPNDDPAIELTSLSKKDQ